MAINIYDRYGNGHSDNGCLDKSDYPDKCPMCHISIHPVFIYATCRFTLTDLVQVIFRCTTRKCGRVFIANYIYCEEISEFHLKNTEPVYPQPLSFPDSVAKISPTFVEICTQAFAAELHNLNQLTGVGLRKSLEFLVKDFACSINPEQAEKIKCQRLSDCIKNNISDVNIKNCAERAVWLGNDETHYIRKWEDRDISDLKILLKLTVNWIESHLLTKEYEQDMPPR